MFTAEQLNLITATVWTHCVAVAQLKTADQQTSIAKTEDTPQNLREAVRTTLTALIENRRDDRELFLRERAVLQKLNASKSGRAPMIENLHG